MSKPSQDYTMPAENKIEIAFSKAKLFKLLVFSILFVAAGSWMLVAKPQSGNGLLNNEIVKMVVGCLGILMGLLGTVFFTKRLLDKNPGLIIDEEGIVENSSAFSFGLIPWADIESIYEMTM